MRATVLGVVVEGVIVVADVLAVGVRVSSRVLAFCSQKYST